MGMWRHNAGSWAGAIALAACLLAPATAAVSKTKRAVRATIAAGSPGFGDFTPAAADPRMAAAFARSGIGVGSLPGGAFRFTPSVTPGGHRAVTVALRAHVVGRQEAAKALALPSDGLAPSAFNLGASVGWKRFALSGDVARLNGGALPIGRESADIGFSLTGRRWATKFDVAADRSLAESAALGLDQSWSVGLGGSYALTHNLNVTGGVRYKTQHDELISLDDKRDSQAVYLGTTFKF